MCGIFGYMGKRNTPSILLKGLEIVDIKIYKKTSDNGSVIKLNHTAKDGQELERIMTIPNDSPEFTIQANFFNNRLYLRW